MYIAVLSLMRYTRFVQDVGAQHRIAPTTVPHLKGKRYNALKTLPNCLLPTPYCLAITTIFNANLPIWR